MRQANGDDMARPNLGRTLEGESNLARRVEIERRSRGWSYAALAEAMTRAGCTINASAIYKIEKGDPPRKITVDELLALAEVFDVEVEDLLTPVEILRKERAKNLLTELELARHTMARAMADLLRATAEYELLGATDPELQEYAENMAARRTAKEQAQGGIEVELPEGVITVHPKEIYEAIENLREKVRATALAAVAASGLAKEVSS